MQIGCQVVIVVRAQVVRADKVVREVRVAKAANRQFLVQMI